MITLYTEKYGFSEADADLYVNIGMNYPKYFLQHMVFEELGLKVNSDQDSSSLIRGITMFGSFILHGIIPLIGFMVSNKSYAATCCVTLTALVILGLSKAYLSGSARLMRTALIMAANGALASAVAYSAALALTVRSNLL